MPLPLSLLPGTLTDQAVSQGAESSSGIEGESVPEGKLRFLPIQGDPHCPSSRPVPAPEEAAALDQ